MDAYIWSMLYAGIVSMQFHPGCKCRCDFALCAKLADEAFEEYQKRKEVLCPGSPQ